MASPHTDPSRPAAPPAKAVRSPWPGAALVAVVALLSFGYDLPGEPAFVDESAYFSQAYFARLFAEGRRNDPAWLTYPAYDLPPLPKYLIGAALAVGGYRTPGPSEARAWYADTSRRFDEPGALTAARVPILLVGVLGCVAVYGLGVLTAGRLAGVVAGVLVAINPLYRLLARRAMSDAPTEAFLLIALCAGLWAWRRLLDGRTNALTWAAGAAAGVGTGLSLLSKMSGLLALFVATSWVGLALLLRPGKSGWTACAGLLALQAVMAGITFLALNPFPTARPTVALPPGIDEVARLSTLERIKMMTELRVKVARDQQSMFAHNAVTTLPQKAAVTAVQGFGRFGPFGPARSDSTKRYDAAQDWGGFVWLPAVLLGLGCASFRGRSQYRDGEPPTAWALGLHFLVTLTVVAAYLPMAWDRYFLALQAPASLLVGGAAASLVRGRPR